LSLVLGVLHSPHNTLLEYINQSKRIQSFCQANPIGSDHVYTSRMHWSKVLVFCFSNRLSLHEISFFILLYRIISYFITVYYVILYFIRLYQIMSDYIILLYYIILHYRILWYIYI
jgi:hypothetical protein